jgi:hypothetical protein
MRRRRTALRFIADDLFKGWGERLKDALTSLLPGKGTGRANR